MVGDPFPESYWKERRGREPTDRRWFLPTVILILVAGSPRVLPAPWREVVVLGLPLWATLSVVSAVVLAVFTAFAALSWWRDPSEETRDDSRR